MSIKAANASNAPFTIAFGGPLAGAGGFTKTGIGTLLLTAANTFSGAATVAAGTLRVDGAIGAGAAMTVGGGALGGGGSVNRVVVLESAGTILPGGSAPGTTLTVGSLTWHGGGTLAVDLASGKRLAVSGALQRGAGGPLNVSLVTSAPLTRGSMFTLATFASTNTVPPDYVVTGPADYRGVILLDGTSLRFLVTGVGSTAAYTDWAYRKGLPADAEGPADDPDNDGLRNLVEFSLETDPMRANPQPVRATTVDADGRVYPAVAFTRRQDLGGVAVNVLASPDARFASVADTAEVSVSARGDGTDDVVVRSTIPLADAARQFFRVTATYPDPQLTLRSLPVAVVTTPLGGEAAGVAVPLIASDLFVGTVTSSGGNVLTFGTAFANVGSLLTEGGRYYVEIVTGAFEGERFDVDAAATIAAATSDVVLSFGSGSASTRAQLPAAGLEGARAVLRPHLTLAALQALLSPGLVGSDDPDAADTVSVLENGQWQRFYLRADGVTWSWKDSVEDFRHKVLAPDTSVLLDLRSGAQVLLQAGNVRVNAFRKNLVEGYQSFASGFPVDLSPRDIGAIADSDDPSTTWTGSNAPGRADEITVRRAAPPADDVYYLRGDGSTWRALTHPASVTDQPILGALNAIVVKRNRANDGFRIPPPFEP